MADSEPERTAAEKGSQQIHPDKPPRDGAEPQGDANETPPGRPQHEARDPDEADW